jgi:hypothetical protein
MLITGEDIGAAPAAIVTASGIDDLFRSHLFFQAVNSTAARF